MSEWPPAGCGAPSRRCESNLAWMLTSSFTSHKPPALFTNIDDAIQTRTQMGDHTGRRSQRMKVVAVIIALAVSAGLVVFHPSRPLYMQQRAVEVTVDDGVVLRGTLSKPRWRRKPVPAVVL